MKAGDRVIVFASWSSWKGQRGTVVEPCPLWVRLDGEGEPMAMSLAEVIPEESSHDVAAMTNE